MDGKCFFRALKGSDSQLIFHRSGQGKTSEKASLHQWRFSIATNLTHENCFVGILLFIVSLNSHLKICQRSKFGVKCFISFMTESHTQVSFWQSLLLRVVKTGLSQPETLGCLEVSEQQLCMIWCRRSRKGDDRLGDKVFDCHCLCWWRQVCLPTCSYKCAEVFQSRQTKPS